LAVLRESALRTGIAIRVPAIVKKALSTGYTKKIVAQRDGNLDGGMTALILPSTFSKRTLPAACALIVERKTVEAMKSHRNWSFPLLATTAQTTPIPTTERRCIQRKGTSAEPTEIKPLESGSTVNITMKRMGRASDSLILPVKESPAVAAATAPGTKSSPSKMTGRPSRKSMNVPSVTESAPT